MAAGATATELMVAATLIAAGHNFPGAPERWKELPPQSTALLAEFRGEHPDALSEPERRALEILADADLLEAPSFTRDRDEIELYWRVREGMQGLIAAMRPPGIALIFEDVCVEPGRVAGNLHFLLTANFSEPSELD